MPSPLVFTAGDGHGPGNEANKLTPLSGLCMMALVWTIVGRKWDVTVSIGGFDVLSRCCICTYWKLL